MTDRSRSRNRVFHLHCDRIEMAEVAGRIWFVYVLRCADGSLYTGVTTDVERRCRQHNAGTASKYTRSRRPIQDVYRETFADQGLALRREAAIKSLSRLAKESLIRAVA